MVIDDRTKNGANGNALSLLNPLNSEIENQLNRLKILAIKKIMIIFTGPCHPPNTALSCISPVPIPCRFEIKYVMPNTPPNEIGPIRPPKIVS